MICLVERQRRVVSTGLTGIINVSLDLDEMNAKEVTQEAKKVQDQTMASTARTQQIIQQTIQIGTETNHMLKTQTDVIINVDRNVDLVENNLLRADKQIR